MIDLLGYRRGSIEQEMAKPQKKWTKIGLTADLIVDFNTADYLEV